MELIFEKDQEKKTLVFSGTVKELLKTLQLNPETVIVTKNNTILSEDDVVENTDTLLLLSVVSGG